MITVIGSSNIDYVMSVPTLPRFGETITDGRFMTAFGGKGCNQAVAAARAGGDVFFVGCVGDDSGGTELLQSLADDGIDISGIEKKAGVATGAALIMLDQDGNNYLAVSPGANAELSEQMASAYAEKIAESEFLVLQMEIPAATIDYLLTLCEKYETKTVFNYAPLREDKVAIDARTDICIVNEVEAASLLGRESVSPDDALACADELRSCGPEQVLITLGVAGVAVSTEEESILVPAFTVKAVDTTAAGDTFCGSLAVALGEKMDFKEAVRFAGAAAALTVTRMGAQSSIPQRSEIDLFLEQHAE